MLRDEVQQTIAQSAACPLRKRDDMGSTLTSSTLFREKILPPPMSQYARVRLLNDGKVSPDDLPRNIVVK